MKFVDCITDVKVYKVEGLGNLKANVSLTLSGEFVLGGLRVMSGSNGLFVSMPSYKTKEGEYKDISFPLSKEVRDGINEKVIAAYQAL